MDDNEEELFPPMVMPKEIPLETIQEPDEPELDYGDEGGMTFEAEEEVIPDIKPREIIEQKDIFVKQKIKSKINDEETPPSIQPVQKEKKKRKPMTEEHKKKLALARDKANATRKANALKRKEDKDLDRQEIELTKQMKQKRIQKMKQLVDDKPTPTKRMPRPQAPTPEPTTAPAPQSVGFSQDDLNKAVLEGIAGYEIIRKQRKDEKKKKLEVENQKKQVFNTINKAITGNPELDQWSNCFN